MMNNPGLFKSVNILSRRDNTEFIEEYEDEIGQISGRCLDVGSGPGDLLVDILLPKLNPETTVVCSDISQSMVNFAKKKYKDNPRLSFMELDIETPDLPNHLKEQFDLVTSFYCLNFCPDMRQTYENIFDLLRPGGTALLVYTANNPSFNAFKTLSTMPAYQPYVKDLDHYIPVFQDIEHPRSILMPLIEGVGFQVDHCSLRDRSYIFDLEVWTKFMLSVNPFVDRMPDDIAEAYQKDLQKEVLRESIILNEDNTNEKEYRLLVQYRSVVVFLKKP